MARLKFPEGQNHMQKNTPNSWPDLNATQQTDWEALAQKSIPDGQVDDLGWQTPDGIHLKALYTKDDL
ncbi:MAG: hypothetical protein RLY27_2327, partial [Pseudomonadota bacterium]